MTATADSGGAVADAAAAAPPASPVDWALCFDVYGTPVTQGSKTRNRYGGMRDDNAETLKPWREAVKTAALDAMRLCDRPTGPVSIRLLFCYDRPRGHYRTGRNFELLRDSAPRYPANRGSGDIDKAVRAVLDACTDGGCWVDDSQVVDIRARKLWCGEHEQALRIPGVRIEVRPVTRA